MPSSSSSSSSMFLSPYTVSLRSRRSFTPNHSNILSPPNLSPIWAGILSNKSYDPHYDSASSEPTFKRPFAVSASRKSMKKLRSSARLILINVHFVEFVAITLTLSSVSLFLSHLWIEKQFFCYYLIFLIAILCFSPCFLFFVFFFSFLDMNTARICAQKRGSTH